LNIEIPYLNGIETIDLDNSKIEQIIQPNSVESGDEKNILTQAIRYPVNGPEFRNFVRNRRHILLIVNDATRPTPTHLVLQIILPMLEGNRFSILIATGTHRAPTEEEYRIIFRSLREPLKDNILVHNAWSSPFFLLGKTRYGNEIRLNSLMTEADAIIPIGSIEPHYFAGYTGGRKSFMPGLADYDCITRNHKLALSPQAQPGALKGNPVAEELEDAEELLMKRFEIFSVVSVLDRNHKIYAAAAGNLGESFQNMIRKADEIYMVPVERKSDIVVTIASEPTDIDLYQAHKAIENGRLALKEGGIIILVAGCRDGIGPRTFFDMLTAGSTCEAVLEKLKDKYQLGYHKAGKLAELNLRSEVWAVTSLDPHLVRSAHIRPFDNVSEAIRAAIREKGEDAKITFIMDGGHTVPKLMK
jgi:nickel-dependent lactate racemase